MSALNERPRANTRRTMLTGGALLVVGIAAAATYFLVVPSSVEQTASFAAVPAPIASASASEAPLPVSMARQTAPPSSGAARADEVSPVVPTPGVGASAAMRDHGQIVITAVNDGTPAQLGRAVIIMSMCRFASDMSQTVARLKSEGHLSGEGAVVATAHFSERERECQSIPPDLMPRQKELAERALLGGARGVALIYADLVGVDPPASMRRPLGEALRADFLDGDYLASRMLAKHAELFGLSRVETRAYEIAFETEKSRRGRSWNLDDFVKPTPALSEEERRQAQELAQTWLRSVNRADRPGG